MNSNPVQVPLLPRRFCFVFVVEAATLATVSRRIAAFITGLLLLSSGVWIALPCSSDGDAPTAAEGCTDATCPMHHLAGQYCPAGDHNGGSGIGQMSSSGQNAIV